MNRWLHWFAFALFVFLAQPISAAPSSSNHYTQQLNKNWQIQSSALVNVGGEQISSTSFSTSGWYSTSVPSTVMSALVKNGVYRDPYFGKNLETISTQPFLMPWWYRTTFDVDSGTQRSDDVRLIFDGINYSANIFLNGTRVASADSTFGAFRRFDVDVTKVIHPKGNVLVVQVYPPKPGDFTIGFVDWNPKPPDLNMGLWRGVKLQWSGPVSIENLFVETKLDTKTLQEARLSIVGTLVNHGDKPVSGKIAGQIQNDINFSQPYSLAAGEKKEIKIGPAEFPKLAIQNPRVWWPNNLGTPELYQLNMTISDSQGISDSRDIQFGIREVSDYINEQGHRGYIVNGKKVLIRGGAWVDDLFLDEDEKKVETQIQYAKHLNLNTIRMEGFWGASEKVYDLADRYGLLLMVGWSCQWEWTHYLGKEVDEDSDFGGVKTKEDMDLVVQYLRDQALWLRNHPSIFVWVMGSDKLPYPELEKRFTAELAVLDPTRPILYSCKSFESKLSGPTAVKMAGPYDYVTPNYWYVDKENGGAFGFDTEVSPGPQPPPMESIQAMFSPDHYWPVDDTWNFHCGRNEFNNMERYMKAFNKRYGAAENLDDFAKKAQAANYEGIRAMFEAFGVRKPVATGIVQWMMNAAWPKMYWQLYDYYLMPGGAYYGARKANRPLNIAYDYSNRSIHIVNDSYDSYSNLNAEVKLFSIESKELLSQSVKASVSQNESKQVFQFPANSADPPVSFLSLSLKDASGKTLADNFYWLSSKPDVIDFAGSEWYVSPNKEYADFTALNEMPAAEIQVDENWKADGITVNLKNPGSQIAFFVELKVVRDKTGRTVLPVFWNDNYVSLLPGETKTLTAQFSPEDLHGEKPALRYSGWNVKGNE